MTPDAIEALNAVSVAVKAHTAESAKLNETLLTDQRQARELADQRFKQAKERENHRFRQVNRALGGLGAGVLLALVLLTAVLVSLVIADRDRDDRTALITAQRECSDILMADALVRISIYATSRGATDPTQVAQLRVLVAQSHSDPSKLDDVRDALDSILNTLPPDTDGLRATAQHANERLLRVREICYRGQPPDDPLAQ